MCKLILLILETGPVEEAAPQIDRLLFALESRPSVAHANIAGQVLEALLENRGRHLLALADSWRTFDRLWPFVVEGRSPGEEWFRDLLVAAHEAALRDGREERAARLAALLAARPGTGPS